MKSIGKPRIIEHMAEIMDDPLYHAECVQVAITGANQCCILFEVSDSDHLSSLSVIFQVEDFTKESARPIFIIDEWLFSLSATSLADLSALEVGRDVWRSIGEGWVRRRAADWFSNRLWSFRPTTTFLIGAQGLSSTFDGAAYVPIAPDRVTLLFDIHGVREDHIYCVGSGGALQRLRGGAWEAIDLSLQCGLRCIDATRPDRLLFGGDDGNCFELRNLVELVEIQAPKNIFFAVREFQGQIYWGDAQFGVYRQRGALLEEFHETQIAFDLRCDDQFLYCAGTDVAWRFDGEEWRSLRLNYANGDFTLV